jgi:hypothetical protein
MPTKRYGSKTLGSRHQHFYHGTLKLHLDSIKQHGLHPCFESEESSYEYRHREPGKAMSFKIGDKRYVMFLVKRPGCLPAFCGTNRMQATMKAPRIAEA